MGAMRLTDGTNLRPLGSNLEKADRRFALSAVACDGLALRYLPAEMQADREVVLKAVSQNGLALKCAAETLRCDRRSC